MFEAARRLELSAAYRFHFSIMMDAKEILKYLVIAKKPLLLERKK